MNMSQNALICQLGGSSLAGWVTQEIEVRKQLQCSTAARISEGGAASVADLVVCEAEACHGRSKLG